MPLFYNDLIRCCKSLVDVQTLDICKDEEQPKHRACTDVDWMVRSLKQNLRTWNSFCAETELGM